MWTHSHQCSQTIAIAWFVICLLVAPLQAATITIINIDAPNEGLNDPAPVTPVGGNTGTTLGQQRLLAAQFAADLWSALLVSDVEIRVALQFSALGGSASGAVLAFAGPTSIFRDFPGAPLANTWYPSALADTLANADLDPVGVEVASTVNSDVYGNVVLGTLRFYYGFDRNAGSNVDFVTTFAHELAHGLGFSSFIDGNSGARLMNLDDAYSRHLIHRGAVPPDFPSMTDAQRLAALTDGPNLRWNGPNVRAASGRLTLGASPEGDVEIYAPFPFQPGSSVSHFSTSLLPNELMEPFITGPIHDVGLTLELFQDLGWQMLEPMGFACDTMPGGDVSQGQAPCEEDVPDNGPNAQTGVIGDVYAFEANAGDQIELQVDTTDANLDPALQLLDQTGNLIASGDDEVPCAVPLVCQHTCPQIVQTIPASGTYFVVVLDTASESCTGGSYEVTADGTGGITLIGDDTTRFVPGGTSLQSWAKGLDNNK